MKDRIDRKTDKQIEMEKRRNRRRSKKEKANEIERTKLV